MYKKVKMESNAMKNVGGSMRFLQQQSPNELEGYMVPQLQRLQQQLRNDLDKVEQVKNAKYELTLKILKFRTPVACKKGSTVQTQIRLLLQKQSDLGLHCWYSDKPFVSSSPNNQQLK